MELITDYEKLVIYEKDYNRIPVMGEIYADITTPILLLLRLAEVDRNFFLLESVEGGEHFGRYSFLGYQPLLRISCKSNQVHITQNSKEIRIDKSPMEALRDLLQENIAPRLHYLPTFSGGLVGYFSYEMIKYAEPKLSIKESEFNDYDFMLFDKVIAFDHLKQKIIIIVNYSAKEGVTGYNKALADLHKIEALIRENAPISALPAGEIINFSCNMSKEEYSALVEITKKYIKEGDIFQAVVSRRFEANMKGSLLNAYRVLRTTNPSPYMYFIQNNDLQITGASPETMVKLSDGLLTTFPVAGTRPRGKTEEEDNQFETELMADEKELSEHNMLVDLARNDIGKISAFGSVKVKEYMKIHRFSKVMHIASVVTGVIDKAKDGCDTIGAVLPAGTLSGAPKFRACEIIDELEPVARGVYGGAIGYLDLSGNLDVCIAIRTAVKKNDRVYVQAGAGIVADSVPEKEYEECSNKASAVIEAIKRASEVKI
ncbi:MAG: trpE [Anaerocolumna sp.]|jgi:anthranilate synthase component 1|nr:trpE [Anaerocolumna sp.]